MTNNIKKLEFLDKFILFITLIYITQMARVENDYGIFFLITYFLLIIFFVIYNFIKKKKYYSNSIFFFWIFISFIYILLSFFELIPGQRRVFYEDQIIRTSYFIFLSYPIVSSSFIIFSRYNNLDILKNDMVAFFFMLILLCLINLIFPIYDDYWFPYKSYTFFELIKFYYFSGTNNIFIFLFFFILLIFYRKKFITFTIFILLFTISTTFQMLIISILFLLIFLIDLRKFLKFSFLIIIFSFLLLPIINLETNLLVKLIGNFDANLYTRISRIHYSLIAVYNNLFFGLGYGADSINDPFLLSEMTALWDEGKYRNSKLIFIHNSIIYIFYTTGLIGGFLFTYYLFTSIFPKKFINKYEEKFYLYIFSIIFISLISNTTLESPYFSLAIFWLIGFLASMNNKAI